MRQLMGTKSGGGAADLLFWRAIWFVVISCASICGFALIYRKFRA